MNFPKLAARLLAGMLVAFLAVTAVAQENKPKIGDTVQLFYKDEICFGVVTHFFELPFGVRAKFTDKRGVKHELMFNDYQFRMLTPEDIEAIGGDLNDTMEYRIWRFHDSRRWLEARYVSSDARKVKLETEDAKILQLEIETLSVEDRQFIRQKRKSKTPPDKNPYRTWTSKNGKFTLEAKFVSRRNNRLKLERKDGTQLSVDLNKLSKLDHDYLRRRTRN